MKQREIKFRAWDSSKANMVNVDQITFTEKSWSCEGGQGVSIPYQPQFTLMQFTGLKDKNGSGNTCLFEGDILSLSGELIGNIYENENLLEDKTNIVIKKLGTKDWRCSEKEAMDRGWGYTF